MGFYAGASLVLCALILSAKNANARMEYAARFNINSCTACHQNPVGGGPRNTYGKLFGAHGYKLNPFLQQQYVSADFRALFFVPERATQVKSGMGIMSGSVAGHVALDDEDKWHLVIDQNIAGFQQASTRDTFALYRFEQEGKPAWFETLMVGRFRAPFGIITDEHRTYARVASGTEWFSLEAGAMLSGRTPTGNLHYDLAVVNGENTGGAGLSQNGAGRWGDVVNLRYMPGPVMFGTSYSYHRHDPRSESRSAFALYAVASLARWTDSRVPVTFEIEHTRSWNWASNFSRSWVADSAYAASLSHTEARAWLFTAIWDVTGKLAVIYKFDSLMPDKNFAGDIYERHGLGIRHWIAAGTSLHLRFEAARATHPSEKDGLSMGAQNVSFAFLQLAF